MGILSVKQYNRLLDAKAAGDDKQVKRIMEENYNEEATIIDVEIESEFDYDVAIGDKSAGLSNGEIAKKHGVSVQKVNSVLKKGE